MPVEKSWFELKKRRLSRDATGRSFLEGQTNVSLIDPWSTNM
jgi:hypothetical protein